MNLFYLFLLWSALFQTVNGEISLTLLDEIKSPIAQETIQFVTEEQQVLASCVTNSQGRCTITIQDAPTDASGFIRGSLSINDHGRRPIIWPGGLITIQLQLSDSGTLDVPSDLYVTRTPKAAPQTLVPEVVQTKTSPVPSVPASTPSTVSTPTSTASLLSTPTSTASLLSTPTSTASLLSTPTSTTSLLSTPTSTVSIVSTPTSTASIVSTPTSTVSIVSTPTSTANLVSTPIEKKTLWGLSYSLWFQIGLLIILITAATYYVLATLSNDNQAS